MARKDGGRRGPRGSLPEEPVPGRPPSASPWAALEVRVFLALWVAATVSNVGTWVQDVGEVWLMTSLTISPLLIALVETATTFPVFAFAIPAGAFADVVDRRLFLLAAQGWEFGIAVVMLAMALAGAMSPAILLLLIVMISMGTAFTAPAFNAILPELVGPSRLPSAVTLTGISINVARAVGPALGGLLVALGGPAATFALNAVSFAGVLVVLYRWKRPATGGTLPPEDVVGAMRVGVRYVRHAPEMRVLLARVFGFALPASALFALLPVLARIEMRLEAPQYGLLLGSLGVGAIAGALALPRLRVRVPIDQLAAAGAVLFAGMLAVLAASRTVAPIAVAVFLAGFAWMSVLVTLGIGAQTVVPGWVRARALAVYLLVFQGGYAAGAFLWGALASLFGVSISLALAAGLLVVGTAVVTRYRLSAGAGLDLTPSLHWPQPILEGVTVEDIERTPAKVTVEYRVEPARAEEFALAMDEMRRIRLRDGALRWDLAHDAAEPGVLVESFDVESWTEHLRQHDRFTVSDRRVEERIQRFHLGPDPPLARHFLIHTAPRPPRKTRGKRSRKY